MPSNQKTPRFFASEGALFLGSGYAANTLVFSTLPQAEDRIFHDELIHASAHEGMRLSRAPSEAFAHNDVDAAADAIESWRAKGGAGTPWIGRGRACGSTAAFVLL